MTSVTKVLTFSYAIVESPVGPLLIAATDDGLVRVAFESEDFDAVVGELEQALEAEPVEVQVGVADAAKQLNEYFAGTRQEFDLKLDQVLSMGFQRQVHEYLATIPFGQTRAYKEVAQQVGKPEAVRAVGTACGANPIPIVVPCHRVVRTDGTLGGYRGGLDVKTKLLELEQVL